MSEIKRLEINGWGELAYAEDGHLVEYDDYSLQLNLAAQKVSGLQRLVDENYSDLLDQMDEAWGTIGSVGICEVNAFIGSRMVHQPTTKLREQRDASYKLNQELSDQNVALNKEIAEMRNRIDQYVEDHYKLLKALEES